MNQDPKQTIEDLAAAGLALPLPASGSPDMQRAIREWREQLGAEQVLTEGPALADYAETTLPAGTRPSAVVRPASHSQVQSVLRVAFNRRVPWHAISQGKNWGYGDRCAAEDGRVIIDLSRMRAIRELNRELGYAVIEPGVTQGQLYEYLNSQEPSLMLDVTGAGPDASVVGNILQRGFGHTPYGDRFRFTSGLEVVLPDGTGMQTGFGRHANAKAAPVFPWGDGPWVDGLFTQSQYGVVTAACVWLMPRPPVIKGFALKISDDRQLGDALTALRELRMSGTVRSTVHVANDLRVLSARTGYPWDAMSGLTPLSESLRQSLRREQGLGAWNILGGLYGDPAEVRAAQKVVRRAFRWVARAHFFDRRRLNTARRLIPWLRWLQAGQRLSAAVESAGSAFDLLEGIPSAEHLRGAFWRCRETGAVARGDVRKSGLIWVSPVLPLTAEAAEEALAVLEPIFSRYRFDLLVTMTAVTDRALCCVTSINYDKGDADERQRAADCAAELHSQLASAGYYPYRNSSC